MLEELIAGADDADLAPPRGGPPAARFASAEGGGRRVPGSLLHPAPLLRELPLRAYETTVLAAPMCHPWGFVQMKLGMRLSSTLILHREFDPQRAAADIARHRAQALAVLPEMLQGFRAVRKTCTERLSSLKVIAVNGRTLPGELAMPAIERFGAVLYSLHGPPAIRLDGYLRPRPRLPVAVGQRAGEREPSAVQRSITVRRARRPG
jgi:hypothetical protein